MTGNGAADRVHAQAADGSRVRHDLGVASWP
jgi:hypothetical protein